MKTGIKSVLAYLLLIVPVIGLIPAADIAITGVNAAEGETTDTNVSRDVSTGSDTAASVEAVNVYVTISDKGKLAVGQDIDHTLMAQVPVRVTDVDNDNALTFNDAMLITHEKYCPGGYSSAVGDYGLSMTKLWNDESFNFGYYIDCQSAWSAAQPVSEGSSIVAYLYKDTEGYSDKFSYFSQRFVTVAKSATLKLSSIWDEYDENGTPTHFDVPYENAMLGTVTVASGESRFTALDVKTDASGNATVSFKAPGTYVVSAVGAGSDIVIPPACIVKVEAKPDAKAVALQKTKQKISSIKSKKAKHATVSFQKNKKATGYQLQYSTSPKFTKKTTTTLTVKKNTYTIKKLKSKKTYYVRVRSIRKVNGKNYYGKYSVAKKITVK